MKLSNRQKMYKEFFKKHTTKNSVFSKEDYHYYCNKPKSTHETKLLTKLMRAYDISITTETLFYNTKNHNVTPRTKTHSPNVQLKFKNKFVVLEFWLDSCNIHMDNKEIESIFNPRKYKSLYFTKNYHEFNCENGFFNKELTHSIRIDMSEEELFQASTISDDTEIYRDMLVLSQELIPLLQNQELQSYAQFLATVHKAKLKAEQYETI